MPFSFAFSTPCANGKPLMDSDWRALLATELPDNTSHASRPDVTGWYTTSFVWSVITMASFMDALKSARAAQQVLFHIQAVDVPLNHAASSEADAQRLHRALLQVPSLPRRSDFRHFIFFILACKFAPQQRSTSLMLSKMQQPPSWKYILQTMMHKLTSICEEQNMWMSC